MIKNLQSKVLLLVGLLLAGVSGAWAEEETITSFSSSSQEGWTITNADYATAGGGYYKLISRDASIVTPSINWSEYSDVTITISARKFGGPDATQGKISVSQGTTELASYSPSNTSIVASSALSISPTDGTITISCPGASSSKGCGVQSIVIKGTKSSGTGGDKVDSDFALTDASVELSFDLYDNATAQVINYTTSSTGAVTVASSEYINAEVGEGTITVTPLKKTNGEVEITVNQAADDDYNAGSATFTVTITDSTPKTGGWELTDLADIEESDVVVIVGNNGANNYAMSNNQGTSNPPSAVSVTIEGDEITSEVDDIIKWNISGNATDGYTFYPDGDSKSWLYCTSSNNGVRVGTNEAKTFIIDSNYLKHSGTSRYVGIYSSQDWRCYTSINSNISGQTFTFYKYVDSSAPTKADPELSFSVSEANATFGQDFTAPTLNAAEGFNGTVEYSSSDETVAQVMDAETGELRIVGGGTTIITASFAGNDDFKKGSASYTLTVTDNRIATTISQEDIVLDLTEVATLVKLTPVVKDANDNVIEYTNDPNGEGLPEVYFELVGEDTDGILGSFDSHGNIALNSTAGTVTIKAVYNHFQINQNYRPSECTFTITIESPLSGIAAFCALESGSTGTVRLTDAVVLYANGKDIFVRDNTGAIDFYDTGLSYSTGDILNGKITAKYSLYNNMHELTTPISNNTLVATTGSSVTPTEIATSDAADNACNLVKFSGVTVTSSNNKFYVDDVQVYDKFKLKYTIEAGKTYDIVGIMVPYNSIYEICPIEAPVEIVVANPSITLEQYEYNLNAKGGDAELPVICDDMPDDPQLSVVFVESDGETVATYDWISASINANGNIAGHIDVNTGDVRTAYFVVTGVDANSNVVKSDLVTINQAAPAAPSITVEKLSIDFVAGGESDRKMSFEYESLGESPTFEVVFVEQDGETAATYDWVTTATIEDNEKVNLSVAANDGAARTAYFKIHAVETEVYSSLITINQAKYVIDYATLPFIWDDKSTPTGVTNSGVETYKSSPYLKFDNTGDYIILKINEIPGTLTFDIKGNSFSDGTFKVQASIDGETYEDLKTYLEDEIQDNKINSKSIDLASDVRYIKWVYTEKVSGNVALGNIILTAPMSVALNAYGYATYASKFALDFSSAEDNGYSAWAVSEINGATVKFTKITESVPAGTGVLLMGGEKANLSLKRVTSSTFDNDNNLLVGITAETAVTSGEYYGLSGNSFVKVATTTIPAGKALLPANLVDNSNARLSFVFDDETTGIENIAQDEATQAVFDLQGRKVQKPGRGIYVVDGKKVVKK